MKDLFEVFSGSTIDASFVNSYLESHNIETIIRNKAEESLLAGWVDPKGVLGTQIFVTSENYEKAEKLVREFLNSREA